MEESKNEKRENVEKVKGNNVVVEQAYSPMPFKFPRHITDIVLILKNNHDLRLFCTYALLDILNKESGWNFDKENGKAYQYIQYLWDKFIVIVDDLQREYRYTEPFFIQAYVAAHYAQQIASQEKFDLFLQKENVDVTKFRYDNEFIKELAESSIKLRHISEYNRLTHHLHKNVDESNDKFHACQQLKDRMHPIVVSMPIECKPAERQPIAQQRKERHNDNNEKHTELNIDKKPSLTVDEMLKQRDPQDLRKAFTLNDTFRFKRELFGNSESDFTDTLNVISAMNSLSEAIEYFYDDLGWNSENEEVKDFIFIISNHFNSKQRK